MPYIRLGCSAVFLLFEKWKKPAKNCPIFHLGSLENAQKPRVALGCASSYSLIFRTLQTPACIHNSINTHAKHERILKLQAEWWGKKFHRRWNTYKIISPTNVSRFSWVECKDTHTVLSSCTQGNFVPLSLIFFALHSPSKLFYQCLPTTDHIIWLSLPDMAL